MQFSFPSLTSLLAIYNLIYSTGHDDASIFQDLDLCRIVLCMPTIMSPIENYADYEPLFLQTILRAQKVK